MSWNLSKKLKWFTKEKYSFVLIWKTKSIRSFFNFKDKTNHTQSVVYERKSNYCKNYIGETGWNIIIKWHECSDIDKNSEPEKHFYQLPEHNFNWKILRRFQNKVRKICKTYFMIFLRCTLNNQLELTS